MSAARCQTRRSGSSDSASASASWARRRRSIGAACLTAERIRGCRNRTELTSSSINPARAAGSSASRSMGSPAASAVASRTSLVLSRSLSAAMRSDSRVCSGRSTSRAAKARSSRSVSGNTPGGAPASSLAAVSGSSLSARGFPAACRRIVSRKLTLNCGDTASTTAPAATESRGASRCSGRPASVSGES